ncbi:MAG: hypothetical protein BWY69_00483 [Planctomycetes bacterium ADurb.Bin401]|nr:MAG: hypothetical protein BWY69_00483 [Planctomycetes bacterium ADurb.Bin401]
MKTKSLKVKGTSNNSKTRDYFPRLRGGKLSCNDIFRG